MEYSLSLLLLLRYQEKLKLFLYGWIGKTNTRVKVNPMSLKNSIEIILLIKLTIQKNSRIALVLSKVTEEMWRCLFLSFGHRRIIVFRRTICATIKYFLANVFNKFWKRRPCVLRMKLQSCLWVDKTFFAIVFQLLLQPLLTIVKVQQTHWPAISLISKEKRHKSRGKWINLLP